MKFKQIVAFGLAAVALLVIPAGMPAAAQEGEGSTVAVAETTANVTDVRTKDEIIYATLQNDGTPGSIYVVNQFEVDTAGVVVDWGEYDSVQNLTNTDPIAQDGDKVSFSAEPGNFYYQGNMTSENLPWNIGIEYFLDGKKTDAETLAGQSGDLEIRLASWQNEKVDPTFYENYMLQITVTLNAGTSSNIDAPDATIADAGGNKTIVYTVFPQKDADFTLHATVSDFEMDGIQISAVPYSMNVEFPDTDEEFGDLEQLPDAVSDLNDGVSDLAEGAHALKEGAAELTSGSGSIQRGLNTLSGNATNLTDASAQINGALSSIAASLNGESIGDIDLSSLAALPQALTQLSEGLGGVSGGLSDLKDGFVPAYAALDSAIQGIPEAGVTQERIEAMKTALASSADPTLENDFLNLVASYTAAQTVKGTYSQVRGAFDAVGSTIDTLIPSIDGMAGSLSDMSTQISGSMDGMDGLDQLDELVSGLSELSGQYASFDSGLTEYMNGVKSLAGNYSAFHYGVASLEGGITTFSDGIDELYEGTTEFSNETADLPDQMQAEIDKMKEEYLPADFDPVSFTSPKNTDTGYVQFVMQTNGIAKEDQTEEKDTQQAQEETFWDRLTALFDN